MYFDVWLIGTEFAQCDDVNNLKLQTKHAYS